MSKPRRANECGLPPHWKIRIGIRSVGFIHVISLDEPEVLIESGKLVGLKNHPILNTEFGDTIGYVEWENVCSVSWRFAPLVEENE